MTRYALNRKLVLEDLVRTPDGAGGFVETWAPLGEVWADVRSASGRQSSEEDARLAEVSMKITVRAAPFGEDSRPRPEQRFRDGARVFVINAVAEADARARFLTCFAKEEVVG